MIRFKSYLTEVSNLMEIGYPENYYELPSDHRSMESAKFTVNPISHLHHHITMMNHHTNKTKELLSKHGPEALDMPSGKVANIKDHLQEHEKHNELIHLKGNDYIRYLTKHVQSLPSGFMGKGSQSRRLMLANMRHKMDLAISTSELLSGAEHSYIKKTGKHTIPDYTHPTKDNFTEMDHDKFIDHMQKLAEKDKNVGESASLHHMEDIAKMTDHEVDNEIEEHQSTAGMLHGLSKMALKSMNKTRINSGKTPFVGFW